MISGWQQQSYLRPSLSRADFAIVCIASCHRCVDQLGNFAAVIVAAVAAFAASVASTTVATRQFPTSQLEHSSLGLHWQPLPQAAGAQQLGSSIAAVTASQLEHSSLGLHCSRCRKPLEHSSLGRLQPLPQAAGAQQLGSALQPLPQAAGAQQVAGLPMPQPLPQALSATIATSRWSTAVGSHCSHCHKRPLRCAACWAQHDSGAQQLSQHGGLMSEHLRWYVYTFV